jgi:uncharacterized membrane protein (UPF0127 family)
MTDINDLEKMLGITIDDALALAMQQMDESKSISNEAYLDLLAKLGKQEQDAFTLGLASAGISVRAYSMNPKNTIRRIKPKKIPNVTTKSEYQKDVEQELKHPSIKMPSVKRGGVEDMLRNKKNDKCPECGTKYEYDDTMCIECGRPRDGYNSGDEENRVYASCTISIPAKRMKLKAWIAESSIEKTNGLQPFSKLGSTEAMLFPFESLSSVTFHMGKVKFPIDIMFLLEDGDNVLKIAKIVHNACPGEDARWTCAATHVLEVKGNTCNKLGLKVGSKLMIEEQ